MNTSGQNLTSHLAISIFQCNFTMLPYFRFKCIRTKRILEVSIVCLYILFFFFIYKITGKRSGGSVENSVEQLQLIDGYGPLSSSGSTAIAVLVLVCNRLSVSRTLEQLFKYRPSAESFPIILSIDCGSLGKPVEELVNKHYRKDVARVIKHPNYEAVQAKLDEESIVSHMRGYYHISAHYGWALNYTFNTLGFDNVIIVEDDLDIAPDFFEYFEATLPLLYKDPTLWCVSSYNDNGRPENIDTNAVDVLYRTDFFPGLGWMMNKAMWMELMGKWPEKFWDDWVRLSEQRKGRACIRPEVPRTKTYGRIGVSNGQFFDTYLQTIELDKKFVHFKTMDLSYLLKRKYDEKFFGRVDSATLMSSVATLINAINTSKNPSDSFRLVYRSEKDFERIANEFGIMSDFKDKIPRGGYKGVVPIMFRERRIYLVPKPR